MSRARDTDVAAVTTPTSLSGGESSASGAQARRSESSEAGQTPVAGNVTPYGPRHAGPDA